MATAPTRSILFKDAMSKGILKRVEPEIRELYNILEVDFHPVSIPSPLSILHTLPSFPLHLFLASDANVIHPYFSSLSATKFHPFLSRLGTILRWRNMLLHFDK